MFILYKIKEQLILEPSHTKDIQKNTRNKIFEKYLYRICTLGICVGIFSINYDSNIILRDSADVLIELTLELVFLQLKQNEYHEGIVVEMNEKFIKVKYLGFLTGILTQENLHPNSHYDHNNQKWVFLADTQNIYSWEIGQKVRFKIDHTNLTKAKVDVEFHDIIKIKANEEGLGPEKWWI